MRHFKTMLSVALVVCAAFALSITVSAHGGHHRNATTTPHTGCGQTCFTACTQTGANHVHTADCGTHYQDCPNWSAACTQDCYAACTQTGADHVHTAACGTHATACPRLQASSNSTATQRPANTPRIQGSGYGRHCRW